MITGTELLEALPVAVYTTDAEGRITFYNRAAAELWGHHPELGSSQWCGSWRVVLAAGPPARPSAGPSVVGLPAGPAGGGGGAPACRPRWTTVAGTRPPSARAARPRRVACTTDRERWSAHRRSAATSRNASGRRNCSAS